MSRYSEPKAYGKIQFGWCSAVILPLDKAAQLIALVTEGLVRETGNYDDRGYVRENDDGTQLSPPSIEVLNDITYHRQFIRGQHHLAEKRAKRDAEKAAAAEEQPA